MHIESPAGYFAYPFKPKTFPHSILPFSGPSGLCMMLFRWSQWIYCYKRTVFTIQFNIRTCWLLPYYLTPQHRHTVNWRWQECMTLQKCDSIRQLRNFSTATHTHNSCFFWAHCEGTIVSTITASDTYLHTILFICHLLFNLTFCCRSPCAVCNLVYDNCLW